MLPLCASLSAQLLAHPRTHPNKSSHSFQHLPKSQYIQPSRGRCCRCDSSMPSRLVDVDALFSVEPPDPESEPTSPTPPLSAPSPSSSSSPIVTASMDFNVNSKSPSCVPKKLFENGNQQKSAPSFSFGGLLGDFPKSKSARGLERQNGVIDSSR
jgi:hypothetical protein